MVNGFREKGKQALKDSRFKAFSLEEEGVKKDNPEYFKTLFSRFNLKAEEVIYFDHSEKNVENARKLGITAIHYKSNEETKKFIESNLD